MRGGMDDNRALQAIGMAIAAGIALVLLPVFGVWKTIALVAGVLLLAGMLLRGRQASNPVVTICGLLAILAAWAGAAALLQRVGKVALLAALALCAVVSVIEICRIRKQRLLRMRIENGLCTVCGYDLRASFQRCPECGTEVPAHHRWHVRPIKGMKQPAAMPQSTAPSWRDRIVVDPDVCLGRPHIRGTRIPVKSIWDRVTQGDNIDAVMARYSELRREDVVAAIQLMAQETSPPVPAPAPAPHVT